MKQGILLHGGASFRRSTALASHPARLVFGSVRRFRLQVVNHKSSPSGKRISEILDLYLDH